MLCRKFLKAFQRPGMIIALGLSSSICAADATLFVDANIKSGGDGQSWETAYRYLQDALYLAATLHETEHVDVLVAQGTYLPDHDEAGAARLGSRDETFGLLNNVTVLGGYAGSAGPDPWFRDVDNQLTKLAPEIGKLTNLTELNLQGNQLSILPPEIGKLTNLKTLDLRGNKITAKDIERLKTALPQCDIQHD